MTSKDDGFTPRAQWLSALADGELEASEVTLACAQWRDDAQARAQWHDYQLIGDVLRSEDLASTAAHDSAFLRSLRQRLEAEPVVLAPTRSAEPEAASTVQVQPAVRAVAGRRRAWFMPSAVAATLAVVVVGGVVTSRSPSGSGPQSLVDASRPMAPVVVADPAGEPALTVANGRLIRDARLDRYLAAHQQWSGGAVVGGHAAYLRQASADAPQR